MTNPIITSMNQHTNYMQQALLTAEQARYIAPPNPWVGCIIVKNNVIIGKGHTRSPGESHAEICALNEAQQNANQATMYVTLEPCSHFGRTPPCTASIIKAGISEIFIAMEDPDNKVQGKGIVLLKEAGIKVNVGLCENEAKQNLNSYIHHRLTGLPYTILKAGISIDGRTSAENGSSKWITCKEARQDAHLIRANSQAIIIGSKTAIQDNPALTVRLDNLKLNKQPLRVILDSKGKVEPTGSLFDTRIAPTLVITTNLSSKARRDQWMEKGAEVAVLSLSEQGVDLQETWQLLGNRGILQALVEGGSHLQTELLKTNLVNQLSVYIGPMMLGATGLPLYTDPIPSIDKALKLALKSVKQIDDCVRLDYTCR
ncbi:MAG: bifunctional diaminohydroxyphosphoribosylaminopyrimidine deaminase/5-amino-6-(5-phosphoribosylamino)uracil reductase RibD [Parachlamydiaceae bacterium]|nr:bifunctional diaminohydroxyphosphoribosylaminopyrimidine deaminase/5-amino-6-(5-phosphoribosylamino)uracil reductase RibD [Parachlamydiaceae bacterium]